MDYDERLTTLLHLFAEISKKIVDELQKENPNITEYREQLQQIDKEINRIQTMRSYRSK